MPSLRQLEYLVAVAETLHFRRAAERTNTTQPTLSEQLKALEDRLGVQLIERSRSRIVMTPVGIQVVEIGRRMLRDASEIRAIAANGGKELAGLLRLGLPPTIGPYLLPHVLPALHALYPELRLYIRESPPSLLPGALEDGKIDIAITMLPVQHLELESEFLFREPLLLAVGADHRLADRGMIDKSELGGEDVLTLGPGHQLHDAVLSLCNEFGARRRPEFEGTSLDTLREMVVMGLGVTFLPGLYVRREILRDPSVRTLEIKGRSIYRTVGLAWRKSSGQRASYVKLASFFRGEIEREFKELPIIG